MNWANSDTWIVVVGALFISPQLESNVFLFGGFWLACFLGAILVLVVALFDMRMVRKEMKERQLELDAELAQIVADAEEAVRENSEEN